MQRGFVILPLGCALVVSIAQCQHPLGGYRPLTLAPAGAISSSGGGTGDEEKAREAELVKKTLNPVASLISVTLLFPK
jgi:hypothetical protein